MKKILLFLFLFLFICFRVTVAQQYIADYTVAKQEILRQIPVEYINAARNDLHVSYQHTSHGTHVSYGIYGLPDFKTGDDVLFGITVGNPTSNMLDFHDCEMQNYGPNAFDLSSNETAFIQATRNYLDASENADINVIMWSWCDIAGHDVSGNYLAGMEALINEYGSGGSKIGTGSGQRENPVTFIFMTGHGNAGYNVGDGRPRNQAQLIIDYCNANQQYCLDYYSIDTYDMDDNYWEDAGDNGQSVSYGGNFYEDYQTSTVLGNDWYYNRSLPGGSVTYGDHNSQHITANRKAYAMWWILARIAGWDGNLEPPSDPPTPPSNLEATAVSPIQIDLTWEAATDDIGVTGYRIYRDNGLLTSVGASELSFSDDINLEPGIEYTYEVTATDGDNNESLPSNSVSESTPEDTEQPSKPENLNAEAVSIQQINLSWSASTDNVGVTGYRIYRNESYIETVTELYYNDEPLNVNTNYSYYITAVDAAGNESVSSDTITESTLEDTNAPSAPDELEAVAVSTTQIDLTWNASADNVGVTGYIIYRAGVSIDTVLDLSYNDDELEPDSSYTYYVTAIDAAGNESGISNTVTERTLFEDIEPPTPPTGLDAVVEEPAQVTLTWNASADNVGVTGYIIYRDEIQINTVTEPGYYDDELEPDSSYSYYITAIDAAGNESETSDTITVITPEEDTEAPSAPSSLTVQAVSVSQIDLTWNASSDNKGVTGYRIYRDEMYLETVTELSYSDDNLEVNTEYSYYITAVDASGNESASSDTITESTLEDTSSPSTPTNLEAETASISRINLSWDESVDNVGVAGYIIHRDDVSIDTVPVLYYYDDELEPNTSYTYYVTAIDAAGNESEASNIATQTTLAEADTEAPTAPANLYALAVSTNQINLTWEASTDNVLVVIYQVYRGEDLATSTANLYFNDTDLEPNTGYTYHVIAIDGSGNESQPSNISNATTLESADTIAPTIPSNLQALAVSSSRIDLSWLASVDNIEVFGYVIYRDGTELTTTTSLLYSDEGLLPNTMCMYQVSAIDINGNESGLSNSVMLSTPEVTATGQLIDKNMSVNHNYPNPFTDHTTISFSVNIFSDVQLRIFDITGKEVKSFKWDNLEPSKYQFIINTEDLSEGIYMFQYLIGNEQIIQKANKMR